MEDGEGVQRAEKVGLKRKLTGPPRLLLGKTRTRSVGEDRAEKTEHGQTSTKDSTAAPESQAELTAETPPELSCRGRRAGGDITTRKRWWSRFSSAGVCIRKKKKKKRNSAPSVPPEGALQEANATDLSTTEEDSQTASEETWWRRGVQKPRKDEASASFQRNLRRFFSRGRRTRAPAVPPGIMEDTRTPEAASEGDRVADGRQACPDGSPAEEEEDSRTQTADEVSDVTSGTNAASAQEASSGGHVSAGGQPSAPPTPPPLLTNGPSIRIELFPPDDVPQEEEEDGSAFNNHFLLLLGFDHRERQLLQTARSLVRAAMNAAVDELSREQPSVHRQPQGCRDHA